MFQNMIRQTTFCPIGQTVSVSSASLLFCQSPNNNNPNGPIIISNGSVKKQDVCRDYLRRACRRGKRCRFRHPSLDEFTGDGITLNSALISTSQSSSTVVVSTSGQIAPQITSNGLMSGHDEYRTTQIDFSLPPPPLPTSATSTYFFSPVSTTAIMPPSVMLIDSSGSTPHEIIVPALIPPASDLGMTPVLVPPRYSVPCSSVLVPCDSVLFPSSSSPNPTTSLINNNKRVRLSADDSISSSSNSLSPSSCVLSNDINELNIPISQQSSDEFERPLSSDSGVEIVKLEPSSQVQLGMDQNYDNIPSSTASTNHDPTQLDAVFRQQLSLLRQMDDLHQENRRLRKSLDDTRRQLNDLRAANEILLEQNARMRNQRRRYRLQPTTASVCTLVPTSSVNLLSQSTTGLNPINAVQTDCTLPAHSASLHMPIQRHHHNSMVTGAAPAGMVTILSAVPTQATHIPATIL